MSSLPQIKIRLLICQSNLRNFQVELQSLPSLLLRMLLVLTSRFHLFHSMP